MTASNEAPYKVGQKIGDHYFILKALSGGMGRVYLCWNEEDEMPYALKTLKQDHYNWHTAQGFKREIANWSLLGAHPHIVQCFGVELIGERPFIISEWISGDQDLGTDLYDRLKYGVDTKQALQFAIDICHGLIHMENCGVVHLDLKPENILVDRGDIAKISDFGLAKSARSSLQISKSSGPHISAHHVATQVAGTYPYMAPEQWKEGARLDTRTDMYALGCILFQLLERTYPFRAKSRNRFKELHLFAPIPRLSPKEPIYNALNTILQICLAKNREDRFSSAKELFRALVKTYQQHFSVSPRILSPDNEQNAYYFVSQASNFFNIQRYDESLQYIGKALEIDPKIEDAYFLKALMEIEQRHLQQAEKTIAQHALLGDSERITALILRAAFLATMGRYSEAQVCADALFQKAPRSKMACQIRGTIYLQIGRISEGLIDLNRCLEVDPNDFSVYLIRAQAYLALERYDEANADFKRVKALSPYMPASANSILAVNYAMLLLKQNRLEDALEQINHSLNYWPDHPDFLSARSNVYLNLGDYEKAKQDIDFALREAPLSLTGRLARADYYTRQGNYNDGLIEFHQLLNIYPGSALVYTRRARLYVQFFDFDNALADIDEAIRLEPSNLNHYLIRSMIYVNKEPQEAVSTLMYSLKLQSNQPAAYAYLSLAYVKLAQHNLAWSALQKSLALDPRPAPVYAEAIYVARANLHMVAGNLDEALEDVDRLFQISFYPAQLANAHWTRASLLILSEQNLHLAEQDLHEAQRLAPEWPQIYFLFGLLEKSRGNTQLGAYWFNEAQKRGLPQSIIFQLVQGDGFDDSLDRAALYLDQIHTYMDARLAAQAYPPLIDSHLLWVLEEYVRGAIHELPKHEQAEVLQVLRWLKQVAAEKDEQVKDTAGSQSILNALAHHASDIELKQIISAHPEVLDPTFWDKVEQDRSITLSPTQVSTLQLKLHKATALLESREHEPEAWQQILKDILAATSKHELWSVIRQYPQLRDARFVHMLQHEISQDLPHQYRAILLRRIDEIQEINRRSQ